MPRPSAESVAAKYGVEPERLSDIPASDRASIVALDRERTEAEEREEDAGRYEAKAKAAREDAAKLRKSGDRLRAIIEAMGGTVGP